MKRRYEDDPTYEDSSHDDHSDADIINDDSHYHGHSSQSSTTSSNASVTSSSSGSSSDSDSSTNEKRVKRTKIDNDKVQSVCEAIARRYLLSVAWIS
jgi:hypothetical protein